MYSEKSSRLYFLVYSCFPWAITHSFCLIFQMSIISSVCAMHDILSKEVFLVDLLDGKRESVSHMKAIVLIRYVDVVIIVPARFLSSS